MSDRVALYRIFGAADVLLYVGISATPERRFVQHGDTQKWWREVRKCEVGTWYPDRDAAAEAERVTIRAEQPKYNRRRATGDTPIRNLRVANELWEAIRVTAREQGRTLTDVITDFLRWYLRMPGAKLPERPPRNAPAAPGPEASQRKD